MLKQDFDYTVVVTATIATPTAGTDSSLPVASTSATLTTGLVKTTIAGWDGAEWIAGAETSMIGKDGWTGNIIKSAPWHLDSAPSSASGTAHRSS